MKGDLATKNIVMAVYKLDPRLKVEREANEPPSTHFIGLGSDPAPNACVRHYRRFYPKELETITSVMPKPTPFESYALMRG